MYFECRVVTWRVLPRGSEHNLPLSLSVPLCLSLVLSLSFSLSLSLALSLALSHACSLSLFLSRALSLSLSFALFLSFAWYRHSAAAANIRCRVTKHPNGGGHVGLSKKKGSYDTPFSSLEWCGPLEY